MRWFKIALPLGIAALLVSVLAVGFPSPSSEAARGGNNYSPTLTVAGGGGVIGQAGVGEGVAVTGQGFPNGTVGFVTVWQVSPAYEAQPTLGFETGGSGSFATSTSLQEPGTYVFHACFWVKAKGGTWDCESTPSATLNVAQ